MLRDIKHKFPKLQFPAVNRPSPQWRKKSEEKWGWVVNRVKK